MRLYLVRHARPQVADGTCYGSTDLAVAQHEQAVLLPALIADLSARLFIGLPADSPARVPIFSSPLQRCALLARALADALQCPPPIHDARLAEMDFGTWEMRTWNEVPRTEVDAWADDLVEFRPGAGENVLQVAARVQMFQRELRTLGHEAAILVCHAGTIRLLLACQKYPSLREIALHAASIPHEIPYGSITVMDC